MIWNRVSYCQNMEIICNTLAWRHPHLKSYFFEVRFYPRPCGMVIELWFMRGLGATSFVFVPNCMFLSPFAFAFFVYMDVYISTFKTWLHMRLIYLSFWANWWLNILNWWWVGACPWLACGKCGKWCEWARYACESVVGSPSWLYLMFRFRSCPKCFPSLMKNVKNPPWQALIGLWALKHPLNIFPNFT